MNGSRRAAGLDEPPEHSRPARLAEPIMLNLIDPLEAAHLLRHNWHRSSTMDGLRTLDGAQPAWTKPAGMKIALSDTAKIR
jgi:hypothetical protein